LIHINVDIASKATGLSRSDLIMKLNDFDQLQVIVLQASGVLNVYKVLRPLPTTTAEIELLTNSIFAGMERREQEALDRTDQMLALITGRTCFSKTLAQHFGDDLPGEEKECGHCTWCITHQAVEQQLPSPVPFNQPAFNAILAKVPQRDDARFLARIAFGISSPRVGAMKLGKDVIFGSMDDHTFTVCTFSSVVSHS
jgi:hypothetical protein